MSCESGTGGVGWSFEFPATVGDVGTDCVLSLFPLFSGGALVGDTGVVSLLKVTKRYERIRKKYSSGYLWNRKL